MLRLLGLTGSGPLPAVPIALPPNSLSRTFVPAPRRAQGRRPAPRIWAWSSPRYSSFDVVLTLQTLEHIPDLQPPSAVKSHRVLVPATINHSASPRRNDDLRAVGRFARWFDRRPRMMHLPPRRRRWAIPSSPKFVLDLKQVIQRAGFEFEVLFGLREP